MRLNDRGNLPEVLERIIGPTVCRSWLRIKERWKGIHLDWVQELELERKYEGWGGTENNKIRISFKVFIVTNASKFPDHSESPFCPWSLKKFTINGIYFLLVFNFKMKHKVWEVCRLIWIIQEIKITISTPLKVKSSCYINIIVHFKNHFKDEN